MRFLMINSVCGVKSTGRICTDIAEMLEKEGHECKIAYGRESVPQKYQKHAVRIGNELGVNIHAGLSRIFDDCGFHSYFATKKFVRWVKEYNPDIIHLHNLHGYYLNLEILFDYLRTCGKKIIWTLHDCWAFTGHCSNFSFVGCDKWKTQCEHCVQKKTYPKSMLVDNCHRNFEKKKQLFTGIPNLTIVTPSKWLAGLVKESFLKDYPIKVIHNGIDLNVFKPTSSNFRERYNLENKKIILGVASVWDDRKGFKDFLKLSELIDDNTRIVLVGVNDKQIKLLSPKIIGIRRTNSTKELAEIYTAADVFFNPTYEDNYPTVNLEAQACGTPVITYNTGGSIESVPKENIITNDGLEALLERKQFKCCIIEQKKNKQIYDELYL